MKSEENGSGTMQTAQKINHFQGEGTNWVLVVGGALLSTLSIKLGYQLKQAFFNIQYNNGNKENRNRAANRRSRARELHSNVYQFAQVEPACHSYLSEISRGGVHVDQPRSPIAKDAGNILPLIRVPAAETSNGNEGLMQASPPDRLELPWKPFQHSNSSDSCISEAGLDFYSKKEVIQKLRQQLKKRDEMIMEMQSQMIELQNSLHIQIAQTVHLQAQVDGANKELFASEQEIQHLRKAIPDHHIVEAGSHDRAVVRRSWHSRTTNGLLSGYIASFNDLELHCVAVD